MDFVSAARALGISKRTNEHNDDSFVDRLNHKYTVVIIVLFTIVISASQYCGNLLFIYKLSSKYSLTDHDSSLGVKNALVSEL
jgi:hypothetical protein